MGQSFIHMINPELTIFSLMGQIFVIQVSKVTDHFCWLGKILLS